MDKKKQMNFNLNNFLLSVSDILDYREIEQNKTTQNHSIRVAFISIKIGEQLNLDPKQMFSLCAYSLFHNYINKNNCNILEIHDDNLILSRIVNFSHYIDETYSKDKIFKPLVTNNSFDKNIDSIFLELSMPMSFWLDLQDKDSILQYIYSALHDFTVELNFEKILDITIVFGNLYKNVSSLLEITNSMTNFYNFEHKDKMTFLISSSLVHFGKLKVSDKLMSVFFDFF